MIAKSIILLFMIGCWFVPLFILNERNQYKTSIKRYTIANFMFLIYSFVCHDVTAQDLSVLSLIIIIIFTAITNNKKTPRKRKRRGYPQNP
jgi:hypothetical protein